MIFVLFVFLFGLFAVAFRGLGFFVILVLFRGRCGAALSMRARPGGVRRASHGMVKVLIRVRFIMVARVLVEMRVEVTGVGDVSGVKLRLFDAFLSFDSSVQCSVPKRRMMANSIGPKKKVFVPCYL